MIKEYDRASASVPQRRLSIGYSRAARIIDTLFELGMLGIRTAVTTRCEHDGRAGIS